MNRAISFTANALAALSVSACSHTMSREQQRAEANDMFVRQAAYNSNAEVSLGELASARAEDPTVRQLARGTVVDNQRRAAALYRLAGQKGLVVPRVVDSVDMQNRLRLEQVPASRFDREYVAQLVADHRVTLSTFEHVADRSSDPEVRRFAEKQIPVLQANLMTAQQLQRSLG